MRADDNGVQHALARGGRRDRPGPCGSYEEYLPHGATAWWAGNSDLVGQKRYKYTGMERDEETGLQRHGVRYYAAWIGRWTSSDPIGLGGGINRYGYCSGDPVGSSDVGGMAEPEGLVAGDPLQYDSFESFKAASPEPWTDAHLQAVWDDARQTWARSQKSDEKFATYHPQIGPRLDIDRLLAQQPEFVADQVLPAVVVDMANKEALRGADYARGGHVVSQSVGKSVVGDDQYQCNILPENAGYSAGYRSDSILNTIGFMLNGGGLARAQRLGEVQVVARIEPTAPGTPAREHAIKSAHEAGIRAGDFRYRVPTDPSEPQHMQVITKVEANTNDITVAEAWTSGGRTGSDLITRASESYVVIRLVKPDIARIVQMYESDSAFWASFNRAYTAATQR